MITGMGKYNVLQSLNDINLESGKDILISAGFAGATEPDLDSGEVFLIENVELSDSAAEAAEALGSSEELLNFARTGIDSRVPTAKLVTLDSPVLSPEEKTAVNADSGCELVDMETYWVASHASEKKVPFLALRVVFDELERRLPPVKGGNSSGFYVSWPALIWWVLKRPYRAIDLIAMYRDATKARTQLFEVLSPLLPRLEDFSS